jgi:hypothetical protein
MRVFDLAVSFGRVLSVSLRSAGRVEKELPCAIQ